MSRPFDRSRAGAMATALFVTFLWSTSWVLIRWGLDDESLEPVMFAALRYGLAALVLFGVIVSRGPLRQNLACMKSSDLRGIAVLGIVFYALTQGAQFVAIDNQPAATTSLVLSWTPLLVALLAGRSLSEPPSGLQLGGSMLVGAGAWAYFSGDLGATTAGMVAALVGLMANVVAALLGRGVNRETRTLPIVVTALSMVVGAGVLAAVGLATEGLPVLSGRSALIIGWLAVVNTAVAFTLWNRTLGTLRALESSAINNTMLTQIAVLGWLFLDETIGFREGLGIVLATTGVVLAQRTTRAKKRARPGTF